MSDIISNEFRQNIRNNLVKIANEEADKIIEHLTELATDAFKQRLRKELHNQLYYIVDKELERLDIKFDSDYSNPDRNIIITISNEMEE